MNVFILDFCLNITASRLGQDYHCNCVPKDALKTQHWIFGKNHLFWSLIYLTCKGVLKWWILLQVVFLFEKNPCQKKNITFIKVSVILFVWELFSGGKITKKGLFFALFFLASAHFYTSLKFVYLNLRYQNFMTFGRAWPHENSN